VTGSTGFSSTGGLSSLGLSSSTLLSESEAKLSGESGLLPSTVQKLGVGLESGAVSSHKVITYSRIGVVSCKGGRACVRFVRQGEDMFPVAAVKFNFNVLIICCITTTSLLLA